MAKFRSEIGKEALKKQIIQGIVLLVVLGAAFFFIIFLLRSRIRDAGTKKELLTIWENGVWDEAYEKSETALASKPMDSFFLTVNGFAAYQTALAQINNARALGYLDNSIRSLKRALLGSADRNGKIRYVLGKAYYAKGPFYADAAVKYLEEAKAASCETGDLNEYLGLAYAAIKEYRKSIEAFTASLSPESVDPGGPEKNDASDMLLLYIAQSYMGMEDWNTAKTYLARCTETTRDMDTFLKAALLLGKTLRSSGDQDGAMAAFNSVLEEGGENAEASYEIGELYAGQGDTTRARAAWRRAYRADPNFTPALARLNAM